MNNVLSVGMFVGTARGLVTFEDDWAQIKSQVRERHSVRMRLNSAGSASVGSGAGSEADLVVHQDDLDAVGNEAFRIHGELRKRSDVAGAGMDKSGAGTTARAAAELQARTFNTDAELYTTRRDAASRSEPRGVETRLPLSPAPAPPAPCPTSPADMSGASAPPVAPHARTRTSASSVPGQALSVGVP
ncbi:hypothetical protein AB0E67_04315 [Streptomyces sp. NPDC032161]|uniref:hypothetical protein n=1 Tax=unclassified Streptomyces TaxID=2593676 RepID=UPI0033C5B29F